MVFGNRSLTAKGNDEEEEEENCIFCIIIIFRTQFTDISVIGLNIKSNIPKHNK
jgi:hypothetical protein